jgi:hypothetical protein
MLTPLLIGMWSFVFAEIAAVVAIEFCMRNNIYCAAKSLFGVFVFAASIGFVAYVAMTAVFA